MNTSDLFSNKEDCCGCEACANSCPAGIIKMNKDEEGFLYPEIVNAENCISCGKCIRICPLKNAGKEESGFLKYYAGSMKDNDEVISCASGGLATAVSKMMINKGGIVYAVCYSDDFLNVEYKRATDASHIEEFKASKYAQAEKGTVYKQIEEDLKTGKIVLFIGLPCDVAAVKEFFKEYNETLYTIELICHGPTSPAVQKQYIEALEKKYQCKTVFFSVRHKKNGEWTPFYIKAVMENGKEHIKPFHKSEYGAAFRYLKRPSCYTCKIKGKSLRGDLMIGDYHWVEKGMKGYNKHGVSVALVHNVKGEQLLNLDSVGFEKLEIEKRGAMANGAIHKSIPSPRGRGLYRAVFVKQGLKKAYTLPVVKVSNIFREIKQNLLKYAVKIKRKLIPSSRPIFEERKDS